MAHSAKSGPREGCERGFPSAGERGFGATYAEQTLLSQLTNSPTSDLHMQKKKRRKTETTARRQAKNKYIPDKSTCVCLPRDRLFLFC